MAAPAYDEREWPLFRITLPSAGMTEREFLAYLRRVDELFLRGERFAVLIDARHAPVHTPTERQELAKRIRASYARYPDRLVAMGIVMSSAVQRGIFTAIMWLAGRTYPFRPFPTPEAGAAWLRDMLRHTRSAGARSTSPEAGPE